jgi:hypothetical protein
MWAPTWAFTRARPSRGPRLGAELRPGGPSGAGLYDVLAQGKAVFVKRARPNPRDRSVIKFGYGDRNQLSLAYHTSYIGLDVSHAAIEFCQYRFATDLAISLDVIYQLTEDPVFETYLAHLFAAAAKYLLVYTTHGNDGTAPHTSGIATSPLDADALPRLAPAEVTRGRIPGSTARISSATSARGTRVDNSQCTSIIYL